MTYILETKNLEKTFGAVVAATEINVKIKSGEVLGVIGANGAGKTTFVNMVTGYLKPSSGEILYQSRNIVGFQPRQLTRLGVCRSFQIPQLFLELTALENVLIALSVFEKESPVFLSPVLTDENLAKAHQTLQRFGIDKYSDQKVMTLPQGVRKLIDIAMATVGDPNLLFLDEPTSGVSADEKMSFMKELMQALQSSDTAVLFIEHDMEIVEEFAPRTIAFYEGKILADTNTDDILQDEQVKKYVIGQEVHRKGEMQNA